MNSNNDTYADRINRDIAGVSSAAQRLTESTPSPDDIFKLIKGCRIGTDRAVEYNAFNQETINTIMIHLTYHPWFIINLLEQAHKNGMNQALEEVKDD